MRISIIILGCFLCFSGCSKKTDLYSQLDELDANEMIALLKSNGIDSTKISIDDNLWKVSLSNDDFTTAVDILKSNGYPKRKYASMGELYEKRGLVSSPAEDWARYIHALNESLAQTISYIDGVVTARVHINVPQVDPYTKKAVLPKSQTPTASVFIEHRANSSIAANIQKIRMLVANAVEGLEFENVEVITFSIDRPDLNIPSVNQMLDFSSR